MSTIFKPLDKESCETLHNLCLATYLDGQCYEFAFAMHRKVGLPMVGLIDNGTIRHVLLRDPDGNYRDVRGVLTHDEIGKPFCIQPPYELRDISESDVLKVRPVPERRIASAAKLAEIIWPELPWDGETKRITAFCNELERLSHKHGLWIRGAYPTTSPILEEAFGEETGYVITPSANAGGYFLDRNLGQI